MKLEVYCDCCHKYRKAKRVRVNGIPLSKDPEQPMDKPATISINLVLSCNHEYHIFLKGETCIGTPSSEKLKRNLHSTSTVET